MKGVSNVSIDYYTAVIFLCVMFVKSFNFKDVIFISEENFQEIGLYKYLRGYSVLFCFVFWRTLDVKITGKVNKNLCVTIFPHYSKFLIFIWQTVTYI